MNPHRQRPNPWIKRLVRPHPTDTTAALVELTLGHWAVIDAWDAAEVGKWNWSAATSEARHTVYAKRTARSRREGVQREVSLHRFVWSLSGRPEAKEVDHADGDGLNCRRANLRAASHGQNSMNRGLPRNNTSGFKGVRKSPNGRRWYAGIKVERKRRFLGSFASAAEAVAAYRAAAVEAFGEFARAQ